MPIKIQAGDGYQPFIVYVHRSRLDKVSTWFKGQTAHSDTIELEVRAETLQAFYTWVYEDRIEVDGLEAEMKKACKSSVLDGPSKSLKSEATIAAIKGAVVDLTEDSESDSTEEDEDAATKDGELDDGGIAEEENEDVSDTTVEHLDGENQDLPWYLASSLNHRAQCFGRLAELYTFGIWYEITAFKVAVILACQRLLRSTERYPSATVIRNVCLAVPLTSGLMQYSIEWHAYYVNAADVRVKIAKYTTLPSEFLTILAHLLKFPTRFA